MTRRSMLGRALGLHRTQPTEVYGPVWPEVSDAVRPGAAEAPSELDAIFASLRSGSAPWAAEDLPADPGAANRLLGELDRLWQNH